MRNLDRNKIKTDEKPYRNILIYHVGYVTVKDLSYAAINRVNRLYLIVNKIDGCIEESNGNKYLTLVPTGKSKDALKGINNYETKSEILLE